MRLETIRAALVALALLLLLPCAAVAQVSAPAVARSLSLDAGGGQVVTLPGPAANVFAADPKIAEVRPASATSLFVFGVSPGRTTIAALDAAGRALAQFQVTVSPSRYGASQAAAAIAAAMPGSAVTVQPTGNGMALSGSLRNPSDVEQAVGIARGFLQDKQVIDNRLQVQGSIQVSLRVRIAEMTRSLTRELGLNWAALGNLGSHAAIGFASANAFAVPVSSALAGSYVNKGVDLNGVIDALAQDNLVHLLAEPNLTAMSGETASFLVGGEFPIPIAQTNNGTNGSTITVDFKQYGVSLSFVPTVLASGRINMHVRPEVSELTNQGAVQIGNLTIPALTVRRVDTTVELGSGESFAIAGLLQDATTLTGNGVPFLGDVPILGALFRSDSFQRNETELVIMVTPYIVRPVSDPSAIKLPTDGWRPPSDLERILLLRQSAGGAKAAAGIPSGAGFVVQ